MSSLEMEMESEIRQLKAIIVQLRLKLEAHQREMERKIEKDATAYNQIIIQLQTSIVELRNELEVIRARHLKAEEDIKNEKNNEIYQLQDTIKDMRMKLEVVIHDSTDE